MSEQVFFSLSYRSRCSIVRRVPLDTALATITPYCDARLLAPPPTTQLTVDRVYWHTAIADDTHSFPFAFLAFLEWINIRMQANLHKWFESHYVPDISRSQRPPDEARTRVCVFEVIANSFCRCDVHLGCVSVQSQSTHGNHQMEKGFTPFISILLCVVSHSAILAFIWCDDDFYFVLPFLSSIVITLCYFLFQCIAAHGVGTSLTVGVRTANNRKGLWHDSGIVRSVTHSLSLSHRHTHRERDTASGGGI